MVFNKHLRLEGQHAFLSASKYHWINYDDDKLAARFNKHRATVIGVELHDVANKLIRLGIKQAKRPSTTLSMYVNDAIGYKMETEQILYFSDNAFGTADAISFKKNILRIFDYKSGETPANMNQVKVYAAYFCLEYGHNPFDIEMDLRIYQNNDIFIETPDPKEILNIMEKTVKFDQLINNIKTGG